MRLRALPLLALSLALAAPAGHADPLAALVTGAMENETCTGYGEFTFVETTLGDGRLRATLHYAEHDPYLLASCRAKPHEAAGVYLVKRDLLSGGCATDELLNTTLCVSRVTLPGPHPDQWEFDLYAGGAFLRGYGWGPQA